MASSCRRVDNTLYLHYDSIGENGWAHNHPMCFEPQAADSTLLQSACDMSLHIRYKAGKPLPPLHLICVAEDRSGELMCDTLRIPLFNAEGQPLAKQHLGVCDMSWPLVDDFRLQKGLSVCLLPVSPQEMTIGIINLGIKLSIHEPDSLKSGTARRTPASH